MKRKALVLVLTVAISAAAFVGCAQKTTTSTNSATKTTASDTKAADKTDAVTTASIVNNNDAFEKALTADGGHYIIAILNDLTFDKPLVVDGDFKTGKKDTAGKLLTNPDGTEQLQRKIALYSQDDKRNVTARFTLTAPSITFNSSYGSLEHGVFKGDLYIAGKNFKLVNQKIDGNIYFLNQEAKDTFKIADNANDSVATVITGTQELKTN